MSGFRTSLSRISWRRSSASKRLPLPFPVGVKSQLISLDGEGGGGGFGGAIGRGRHLHSGAYQPCFGRFKLKKMEGFVTPKEVDVSSAVRVREEGEEEEPEDEEGQGYLNSHPYRKMADIWKSKSTLAKYLVENLIHNDHGLFVTNKPFGVGVRKPSTKQLQRKSTQVNCSLHLRGLTTCPYTLEDLLPELRYLLDKPNLVLVRSTEKLTSGIAVFADDEATGARFSKSVASSKMYYDTMYRYHVITVMPPLLSSSDPNKIDRLGVTVMPIVGKDMGQPVILRDYSKNSVKRRDVVSIHCLPRILQFSSAGASTPTAGPSTPGYLVELNTSSISYNFLRIYCADKLAPILGDHLYSNRVQFMKGVPIKIDPSHLSPGTGFQKLPSRMLELLDLKAPEDSLMVPTHSHLRSYKVRNFLEGGPRSEMEFEAPYPPHFKWTCEQLGIILQADQILEQ